MRINKKNTTDPVKNNLTLPEAAEIQKRTATAKKIGDIFEKIQPGQVLANTEDYLKRLDNLHELALQDAKKLYAKGIKNTEITQKARQALQEHFNVLEKAAFAAIHLKPLPQKTLSKEEAIWEGRLQQGETPLHCAVRYRDEQRVLKLQKENARSRLYSLCLSASAAIKNKELSRIVKNPTSFSNFAAALEKLYAVGENAYDEKNLKKFIDDPSIINVFKDAEFKKFCLTPALTLLTGVEAIEVVNARGLTPMDEAFLQKNASMTRLLLPPNHLSDPEAVQIFQNRLKNIEHRVHSMRQVNPTALPEAHRAAYTGNTESLRQIGKEQLTAKDSRGLTPLHYALLGQQKNSWTYLLEHSDIYGLTSDGLSYLDVAIASGDFEAYSLFNLTYKLPFRMAKASDRIHYLHASGILEKGIEFSAQSKDPLTIQNPTHWGYRWTDVIWTAAKLSNRILHSGGNLETFFNSTGLSPSFSKALDETSAPSLLRSWTLHGIDKVQDLADSAREFFQFSRTIQSLPFSDNVAQVVTAYSQLSLLYFVGRTALSPISSYMGWTLPHSNFFTTPLSWIAKAAGVDEPYINAAAGTLRVWSAVKPVWDRIPLYKDTFISRPSAVIQEVFLDLVSIGSHIPSFHHSIANLSKF